MADALVDAAIKGNVEAAQEIFDRIDGRLPQDVGGEDGAAVRVRVGFAGGWPPALLSALVLRRPGRLVMSVDRPPDGAIGVTVTGVTVTVHSTLFDRSGPVYRIGLESESGRRLAKSYLRMKPG